MKTDRELLEMAAKAAGLPPGNGVGEYAWDPQDDCLVRRNERGLDTPWNPLADDGDAFRLSMALKLPIRFPPDGVTVESGNSRSGFPIWERIDSDLASNARRAIVRAAAAIGEQLP